MEKTPSRPEAVLRTGLGAGTRTPSQDAVPGPELHSCWRCGARPLLQRRRTNGDNVRRRESWLPATARHWLRGGAKHGARPAPGRIVTAGPGSAAKSYVLGAFSYRRLTVCCRAGPVIFSLFKPPAVCPSPPGQEGSQAPIISLVASACPTQEWASPQISAPPETIVDYSRDALLREWLFPFPTFSPFPFPAVFQPPSTCNNENLLICSRESRWQQLV